MICGLARRAHKGNKAKGRGRKYWEKSCIWMVRQGLSVQSCEERVINPSTHPPRAGSCADMSGGSIKGRGNSPAGLAQWSRVDL